MIFGYPKFCARSKQGCLSTRTTRISAEMVCQHCELMVAQREYDRHIQVLQKEKMKKKEKKKKKEKINLEKKEILKKK